MTPTSVRRAARPLLLALFASLCALHAAAFPTGPSPAVVQPAPPPLPAESGRWLPFRVFDWRDGLEPHVSSLAVDRQGSLWAGTPNGTSVYNGSSWKKVPLPTDPPDAEVTRLLAASDGSSWFGTRARGLFRLREGVWSRFDPGQTGPAYPSVQFLVETVHAGQSVVWAATTQGLARCAQETCRPVPDLWGLSIRELLPARREDGKAALWVGTEKGLVRLDGIATPAPSLAPLLFDERNALPSTSVRSLAETVSADGQRSLWVGTDQGLARLRNGAWTRYDARASFPPIIAALLPGRWQGRPVVWAATFGAGLVRIEESTGRWERFDTTSGLPASYLYALLATDLEAEEPTLWIATAGGLARLDRERWHTIDSRSGLPSDMVLGAGEEIFPDGRATYWVGTANGTVLLTERGWEPLPPHPGHPSPVVLDVGWTREGREAVFWMATAQGLLRYTRGRWSFVLPSGQVYFFETVPAAGGDELWTGSPWMLGRFSKGRWSSFQLGTSLPGRELNFLEWSWIGGQEAAVWAGTDAGLARFAAERWQAIAVPCLPHPGVLSIYSDADAAGNGWLWLGTRSGIARVRLAGGQVAPGECQSLREKQMRLANPQISEILSDAIGRIYLFSNRGVARLTLPADGSLARARLEMFDTEDGLPGINFTRASFRDRRGRIWSGSASGIAIFDPSQEPRRTGPPHPALLRIERLLLDGEERSPASGLVLQPGERRLEIEFALLRFRREHATRFQTQLAGLEEHPSPWTPEARVVYDRLPPGRYTFRAWGRDGDGVVSGPVELGFRVLPPPWLTPWAFLLYVLALAGLVYGAVRLRVRTLARQAAQLEVMVAERTRDLAEANRRLERASFTDPLTGLNNRRFLASTIRPDVVQAVRNHREPVGDPHHRDLVVYLLDLDHFKRLNDRAGHDAGDAVLVETARRLRGVVRASDLVVRWGGEEILIVSRWTDRATASLLAERVLAAIGGHAFRTGIDRTSTVTCSIGWAPFPWSTEDPDAVLFEEVLSLADHVLYLAKRAGRNRSVGVLPGATAAEEVAERILREDAPLHTLEGLGVELVWSQGPEVGTDDRTATVRMA